MIEIKFFKDVKFYKRKDDVCYDLYAAIDDVIYINANETVVISTGIGFKFPKNIYAKIYSRSGLASRGISVLNSPGIIDTNYRGEIKIILHNSSGSLIYINPYDRIAQLSFETRVDNFDIKEVEDLGDSDRGLGCLGSTGR